jgi:hypothetical protein
MKSDLFCLIRRSAESAPKCRTEHEHALATRAKHVRPVLAMFALTFTRGPGLTACGARVLLWPNRRPRYVRRKASRPPTHDLDRRQHPGSIASWFATARAKDAPAAWRTGVKLGRKPTLTPHQRQEAKRRIKAGKESVGEIARSYDFSRWTISRLRFP